MKIIILGPTGTGKGTQADFIAKLLRLYHIDCGALIREEAKKNKFIKNLVDKGDLLPDNITIRIVNKEIKNSENFILDGFPRTLAQAKALKFKPDLVLFLKTSKNNLVERLVLRKRRDDTRKNIEERYKLYLEKTIPVIKYYKKMGNLITINGNPSIKDVSKEIKKVLMKSV